MKVWDVSRLDKNGVPFCYRITKLIVGNKPIHVSAICVDEGLQLLSVGFVDGTVLLYRYLIYQLEYIFFNNFFLGVI